MTTTALILVSLYFAPAINAGMRGHHNSGAIFALNLLLGWTALGWIIAFVWSCTAVRTHRQDPRVEARGPLVVPKPKPKPFLPKDWDKPKPVAASAGQPSDAWLWAVPLAILIVMAAVGAVAKRDAILAWMQPREGVMPTWYKAPEPAGIQYTGSVLEGLTREQIKKLEAERDAIPVMQSVPSLPKKTKARAVDK